MAALWMPELLLEIASHLSDLADISRFSKCDRMSREMIMPLLFRNICIPLKKAASVAYVLGKYPHYARRCSLFSFEGSSELEYDQYLPMFEHLAAVLRTLATNAHVKSVWWCRKGTVHHSIPVVVPTYIWQALSALSRSLEELRICMIDGEDNWHPICAPEYPQLRMLDVWLGDARGWHLSPLQVMLNGLSQLEDLYVRFPLYHTSGVDLSSYHPHLRTFSFVGEGLPSSFLNRHPTIQRLRLRVHADSFTLGDHDLPHLKVLCVDGPTISNTPSLFSPSAQRPITHLRLDNVDCTDIPDSLAKSTYATLRHLEIEWSIKTFRFHMFLFQHFSQLEELRLVVRAFSAELPSDEEDLVRLLSWFSDSTSIRHLEIVSIGSLPLSEPFLSDIGSVPASLEYLTWDLVTYRLESREGKTVAVLAELPHSREDILDSYDVDRI